MSGGNVIYHLIIAIFISHGTLFYGESAKNCPMKQSRDTYFPFLAKISLMKRKTIIFLLFIPISSFYKTVFQDLNVNRRPMKLP